MKRWAQHLWDGRGGRRAAHREYMRRGLRLNDLGPIRIGWQNSCWAAALWRYMHTRHTLWPVVWQFRDLYSASYRPADGNSHVLHFFNGCNSKVYKRGNGATIDLCLSINMRVDQCKNKSAEKCALPQMAPSDLPLWNIANKSMKRDTLSAERMVNTRLAIHFGMNCWCFIHRVRRGLIGE